MLTEVLTRAYDNGRTGSTYADTVFTPDSVATKGLRRFKSLTLTGDDPRLEAQPLYVPNLTIEGKQRNVVFIATVQSNGWAFDADEPDETKHLIWKTAHPLGESRHDPDGMTAKRFHQIGTADIVGLPGLGVILPPADAGRMDGQQPRTSAS